MFSVYLIICMPMLVLLVFPLLPTKSVALSLSQRSSLKGPLPVRRGAAEMLQMGSCSAPMSRWSQFSFIVTLGLVGQEIKTNSDAHTKSYKDVLLYLDPASFGIGSLKEQKS